MREEWKDLEEKIRVMDDYFNKALTVLIFNCTTPEELEAEREKLIKKIETVYVMQKDAITNGTTS